MTTILDPTAPWLASRARTGGEQDAIRFEGRRWSWNALAHEAEGLAGDLARHGVARGDLVAVRMAPQPRMVALLHALQAVGAAMLPLNLRLASPEAARILAHAGPRLVVDDGKGAGLSGCGLRRVHPFDDLAAGDPPASFVMPTRIDPGAALTVVYTSGTTSAPKGVVLTNANHAAAAAASRERLGHGERDAWLATLALFHVGGLAILARSALEGSVVLLEDGFDVARTTQCLQDGEATMVSLVPTMLARVLDSLRGPVSPRVRAVLVGGAALSPSLGRRGLDAGLPIATTWGMTEACSQICTSLPRSEDAARAMVGPVLGGVELKVDAPDADGFGELLVRGPNVMKGYLRNPDADRAAREADWLRTGDVGRVDERGSVALSGRRDDLILTGGENVAPVEVEHVLDDHPAVKESLVLGEPDEAWGQRVCAVVVAASPVTAAELEAWCRGRIAGYKVPRSFRFTDALERNATGKVLRRRPA